jgi:predicted DsbA family dithiol-disulfide isomerase
MIKLDIFSDPICPWCYLGKANLERALEAHPDHPFDIEWHPFQLNPEMVAEGEPKRDYLAARFGGTEKLAQIHQHFKDMAAQAGVVMDPDVPQRIPNTLNAHRMIHWAGLEGLQAAMVSAIMRAYWVQGRDIGDLAVLEDLGAEAGLDRVVVQRLLASEADLDLIQQREAHSRERGVNAVPTCLIAGQYVLSGAQPPDMWGKVIGELARMAQENGAPSA